MQPALPRPHLRGNRAPPPPPGAPPARDAATPDADALPTDRSDETWLCCRGCGHRLARRADRFAVPGHPPVASFVNPGGFVHEVLTLRDAPGCLHAGRRVRADSWFPGYTWRFALCGGCTGFVGWFYEALAGAAPTRFWGLRAPAVRED